MLVTPNLVFLPASSSHDWLVIAFFYYDYYCSVNFWSWSYSRRFRLVIFLLQFGSGHLGNFQHLRL